MTAWAEGSHVLLDPGCNIATVLKAFDGAPTWTLDELRCFKRAFEEFDFIVTKMPRKAALSKLPTNHA